MTVFMFLHVVTAPPRALAEETGLRQKGDEISSFLRSGEIHRHPFEVAAGTYFWLTMTPGNGELLARLVDEVGEEIYRGESVGAVYLYGILETGGNYWVEVSRGDSSAGNGAEELDYRILLEELEQADETVREKVLGYREYYAGKMQQGQRNWQQAILHYERSLPSWHKTEEAVFEASTLQSIGLCHRRLEDLAAAAKAYELAVAGWRRLEDRAREAKALINLAVVQRRRVEFASSRSHYERALELLDLALAEAEGSRGRERLLWDQANALNGVALVAKDTGDLLAAKDFLVRAHALYEALEKPKSQALALANLGMVETYSGDLEAAQGHLEVAIDLATSAKDSRALAVALSNLGVAYEWSGESRRAIDFFRHSLALNRELGNRSAQAEVWRNLGSAHLHLGDFEEALRCYAAARALAMELQEQDQLAEIFMNLGWVHALAGRFVRAQADLAKAMSIFERLGGPDAFLSSALARLGRVEARLGEKGAALAHLHKSRTVAQRMRDPRREGRVWLGLGETHERFNGDEAIALKSFRRAADLGQRAGEIWVEIEAFAGLARIELRRNELAKAQRAVDAVLHRVESVRGRTLGDRHRTALVADRYAYYRLAAEIALERHQREPGGEHHRTAFAYLERARARSLLDLVEESTVASRQLVLWDQLLENGESLGQLDQVGEESLPEARPLSLEQIQTQVLDEGTLLLNYVVGASASHLFAVGRDLFQVHELPGRAELDGQVGRYLELLTAPAARAQVSRLEDLQKLEAALARSATELDAVSVRLGEALLGPVHEVLEDRRPNRLVIVADGRLAQLPFAALRQVGQSDPLVVQSEIVRAPSASVVEALRKRSAQRPAPSRLISIFADPVVDAQDSRLEVRFESEGESEEEEFRASLRGMARRIPHTQDELEAILGHFPSLEPQSLVLATGFQATREALLSTGLEDFNLVHLATHGFQDLEQAGRSGLLFSRFQADGATQEGVLRPRDIYPLEVSADLVVLSACRTGGGSEVQGEGLLGLVRSFFAAGATRVVASQWPVEDAATAVLMDRFYEALLRRQEDPGAALRQAQLALLEGRLEERWRHPFYWAGFEFHGPWLGGKPLVGGGS